MDGEIFTWSSSYVAICSHQKDRTICSIPLFHWWIVFYFFQVTMILSSYGIVQSPDLQVSLLNFFWLLWATKNDWLVVSTPPKKYERQLGWFFPIVWNKEIHDPNHQPDEICEICRVVHLEKHMLIQHVWSPSQALQSMLTCQYICT